MAVYRQDGWVKSVLGQAVAGALIYVCTQPANISVTPSPLASIFSDPNGLVPLAQPIAADGFGHYDYYAAPGTYTVVIVNFGQVQQVYPDQSIFGFSTSNPFTAGANISISGLVISAVNVVTTNPVADQTILSNNLLPASGNTTQSLGSSLAPWNAVLGVVQAQNFEKTLYADQFPGSDIGAKINAAYASVVPAGATTGGVRIKVPAGTYPFSTPIVFNAGNGGTNGTWGVVLEGDANGTILNFTGGTLAAPITAISMTYSGQVGSGIRDLTLTYGGTGTAATGLALSTATSAAISGYFLNMQVYGFAVGINTETVNTFINTFINCKISHNTTAGILVTVINENLNFLGGSIDNNGTGVLFNTSGASGDFYFRNVSFDDNTAAAFNVGGISVNLQCDGCHFENVAGGTGRYFVVSGFANLILSGGVMYTDAASGTLAEFIQFGGNMLHVSGMVLYSNGQTVTQAVNMTAGGAYISFVDFYDGNHIVPYNTAYTGGVIVVDTTEGTLTIAGSGSQVALLIGPNLAIRDTTANPTDTLYIDFPIIVFRDPSNSVATSVTINRNLSVAVPNLIMNSPAPVVSGSQLSIGNVTGVGNGSLGAVSAPAKGGGSGPTTPGTIVGWMEINVGGTSAWVPYAH
jgi:hypothetical protein